MSHLAGTLADAAAKTDITAFASIDRNAERAEAAYLLATPLVKSALAGDGKAWLNAFQELADVSGDRLYLRNYARNRLADTLADSVSAHWLAGAKRDAKFWQSLLVPVIMADENSIDDFSGHFASLLLPLLAASGDTALADWRKSLPRPQLSILIKALDKQNEIWRNAGRLAGDDALKTRQPLAARLKLVTHLLADDVVCGRYPTTLFTKIMDEGVLSRREIADNAASLYEALAKKNRHALTLAEFALDAGKAPVARTVIDAALDAKTAPADDFAFDLLEMRFGIEVRERQKEAAAALLKRLESHTAATANKFTLTACKRLMQEWR